MSNLKLMPRSTYKTLSPAGCKILDLLLKKGCAYHVRGAWRFRGCSGRVSRPNIAALLSMGLAEELETDRYAQIRITDAGRKVSALLR